MHRVVEEILEANKWRDGEFAKFKVNSLGVEESLWSRMCIPMIYAHWEGFVVSSLKVLIEHLNTLELKPNDVPTNLIVIGVGDAYKFLSGKQSFEQRITFTNNFNLIFKGNLKFKKKIDTRSNLKSEVLAELCSMFCLDFNKFKDCTANIDTLVNIRNSIAHGENSIIPDMKNIEKYIDSVNMAIDIFINEINIFLDQEKYLSKS